MGSSSKQSGSQEPPALILGSGITALGVQRVLGRSGIPYYSVNRHDRLLRRSRWFRPLPTTYGEPEPGDLEGWLDQVDLERAVLFPCADEWALSCARVPHGPSDRFPASLPDPDSLVRLIDKARLMRLLDELDVPRPWTHGVRDESDLASVPWGELAGDAFLKPRDSQRFMARFGVKAVRVRSEAEASRVLRELGSSEIGFVVQEYVPGPASSHYFVDGFRDRLGERRASFVRQRLRMYPPDFGNSSFMKSIAPHEAEQAVQSLDRVLEALDYRGIYSAEFKRDPRDGEFKLLEVNARAWWFVEFAAQCGVDVCSAAYLDALGHPVPDVETYAVGHRGVHPYFDYYACRSLWREGRMSALDWLRSWLGARQPVFQWMDPWPGVAGTTELVLRRLRQRWSRLRSN